MPRKLSPKVILPLLFAITFFMYQETDAQKKPSKQTKPAAVEAKPVPPDIAYTVSMSKPATHLLEVSMTVNWKQMPDKLEVKMPVWTPGSYLIREYARHVQAFAAKDATGAELAWRKINKNTWQIDTKGAGAVALNYKVYANELTVRTNELNDEHAFWNNGATLMFIKGQLSASSTVTVNPFGSWKVATGLPKFGATANIFIAENYDVLYDSPFEVSNFKEINFEVQGKPHRYVITGEGNYDLDRLVADTTKIIDETYKIFGELPYKDYTFILNTRGGGGLEHMNSTALQTNRFAFKPDSRYKGFLGLVGHEFVHVFLVKSIRPDALGPFDYENENYTKLLWVAEGGTEYYSNLILLRAGLITAKQFLGDRASGIQQLQNRPGRFETSVEDASFDAWIKYYRPDENAINNQISYYDKGEIVSMMLDVSIRSASGGAKSLDDVMRHLYNEFAKKNKNFTPEDFQKVSELMAGKPLDDFFAKYVRGTAEIDYDSIMGGIGLSLAAVESNAGKPFIGADTAEANGVITIRSIAAGTPAYEQGLNTGDQIVAIDGYRASSNFLQSYVGERKPGDKIKLTIFRFDKLRDMTFTLGSNDRKDYSFAPVAEPTEEQKKLYNQYLNAELK
ncbi:MAG: M61 family metallopeptidase [Pyrinomonadaceae bacterium]|nr:M61 family metallopeptidase [Acidobacteriota bacterium]MBP7377693.1 M61 family metallopeptidase [Pyrinomonadaceae bacterium]